MKFTDTLFSLATIGGLLSLAWVTSEYLVTSRHLELQERVRTSEDRVRIGALEIAELESRLGMARTEIARLAKYERAASQESMRYRQFSPIGAGQVNGEGNLIASIDDSAKSQGGVVVAYKIQFVANSHPDELGSTGATLAILHGDSKVKTVDVVRGQFSYFTHNDKAYRASVFLDPGPDPGDTFSRFESRTWFLVMRVDESTDDPDK
jgi:uncharacterized small protein (DUF1192 family)